LLGPSSQLARQAAFHLREQFSQIKPSRGGDESDEMHGVEVEVSDREKYHAQKSIRRSVVSKDKLSWS